MKLVVIKNNFQVLLVPNYRDLRYELSESKKPGLLTHSSRFLTLRA